ncbi:MAG: ATP-NAD kinase [Euryarchaeota archaeon]|nr:ATP-NAD kinase [Euryarchaeota archaeon]
MRVTLSGGDQGLRERLGSVVDIVRADDEDPTLVITVGEEPLSAAAARSEQRPVVPVGLDAAWSPSREVLPELLASLTDRSVPTVEAHPLVVSADGTQSTAAFDTTLVTSEPARISEYAVSVDGRQHATFRADGVVVASPLGSHGYNRAAGGPQLGFATGLAVVPIAPFATIADAWVVEPPLSVSVERETAVSVFADTEQVATGGSALTVEIETGPSIAVVDSRRL